MVRSLHRAIFAFLLSQLVVDVTTGEQPVSFMNRYAIVPLFLALANSVTSGLKYYEDSSSSRP